MAKGADLCKAYFLRTFEDPMDASAFSLRAWAIEGPSQHFDIVVFGARFSWSACEEDPMQENVQPKSMPAHPGSAQLMPATVMIQTVERRKSLYKNPHYFVLKWIVDGAVLATVRVNPRPDGSHPLARLHVVNGDFTLTVC